MENAVEKTKTFVTDNAKMIIVGLGVLVLLYLIYVYFVKAESFMSYPGQYYDYTPEGFYAHQTPPGQVKRIVLFYSPQCGVCHNLTSGEQSPWKTFTKKYSGRPDIVIETVNCDEQTQVAQEHDIKNVPTFKVYDQSGNLMTTDQGYKDTESLEKLLGLTSTQK